MRRTPGRKTTASLGLAVAMVLALWAMPGIGRAQIGIAGDGGTGRPFGTLRLAAWIKMNARQLQVIPSLARTQSSLIGRRSWKPLRPYRSWGGRRRFERCRPWLSSA